MMRSFTSLSFATIIVAGCGSYTHEESDIIRGSTTKLHARLSRGTSWHRLTVAAAGPGRRLGARCLCAHPPGGRE